MTIALLIAAAAAAIGPITAATLPEPATDKTANAIESVTNDVPPSDIVVYASLVPTASTDVPASTTVLDAETIKSLGQPLALDLIRLSPGVTVAPSGAQGSLTQIRIRGAEANHTLVFVDGIDFNDPAAGNEARFETFGSDGLSRIEIVRGPQSALWGSEALGGVIALETPAADGPTRASAAAEGGSHGFYRGAFSVASGGDYGGLSATAAWTGSDGIDILGGGKGDRDGFENRTASLKAVLHPGGAEGIGEFGFVGHYIYHHDEFDGTDPLKFLRADTQDNSTTETGAVRAWATLGRAADAAWSGTLEAQYLDSHARNRDGETPLNATVGDRLRISGQLLHRLALGDTNHTLIARVEREDETFRASDVQFGGSTDQRRTRGRIAYVGEWRGEFGDLLSTDVAIRHDSYNRFGNATTVRAGAVVHLGLGFSLDGAYGQGIAQPTFFDLYGFFPGSFVGNPDLTPERSHGYEAGVKFASAKLGLAVTAFNNRFRNEIVSTFDSATFISSVANATGTNPRRGIEASGTWRPLDGLNISANYTYLDAKEQSVAGAVRVREVRRAKNTANLDADWKTGPLTLGASVAYVGKRRDTDFDTFETVTLKDYALIGARIAFSVLPNAEIFGRIENAADTRYQDVVGYRVPRRTVFGGVRFRFE